MKKKITGDRYKTEMNKLSVLQKYWFSINFGF